MRNHLRLDLTKTKMFNKGDLFLNKHTFDLYVFNGTEWIKIIPLFTTDKNDYE